MIQVLFVLLVPTLLGIALRKLNANVGAVVEMIGGLLGVLVILFLVGSWVPRNWQLLLATGFPVYVASIGLGLAGFCERQPLGRAASEVPDRGR